MRAAPFFRTGGKMDADRRKKLESLERRVGYSFNDKRLLDMALTHTSYVKGDGRASAHNERLEFWAMRCLNFA